MAIILISEGGKVLVYSDYIQTFPPALTQKVSCLFVLLLLGWGETFC
jgi:hypothetical protein